MALYYLTVLYEMDFSNSSKTASQHFAPILTCTDPLSTSKKLCRILSTRPICEGILRLFYESQGTVDGVICNFREESKLRQELALTYPYIDEMENMTAAFNLVALWKWNRIRLFKMMQKYALKMPEDSHLTIKLLKMQMMLHYKLLYMIPTMRRNALVLKGMNLQA